MIKNLTIPLVSIDAETTGVDPAKDRIITLGVWKVIPNVELPEFREWKLSPGIPIPAESTAVHGIKDADLIGYPQMSVKIIDDILDFMGTEYVLAGFNLLRFDIPIFIEEMHRHGFKGVWPKDGQVIIDCGNIFKLKEERTLTAAVKKYCGRDHAGAHGALADAGATCDVLHGQLAHYPDLADMDAQQLAKFSTFAGMVDFAGKLGLDKEGHVIYNIGKSKGNRVKDDTGMAYWMLERDFTQDTKRHLRRVLGIGEQGEML